MDTAEPLVSSVVDAFNYAVALSSMQTNMHALPAEPRCGMLTTIVAGTR